MSQKRQSSLFRIKKPSLLVQAGIVGVLLMVVIVLVVLLDASLRTQVDIAEGSLLAKSLNIIGLFSNPSAGRSTSTILVMVATGLLISLISSFLAASFTVALLQKRRSTKNSRTTKMLEDHFLILGWSPKIFPIVSELSLMMEQRNAGTILILANKSTDFMYTQLAKHAQVSRAIRLICYKGLPTDVDDIQMSSPQTACTTIVLPTEETHSDTNVIKALMALVRTPHSKGQHRIITEIYQSSHRQVANIVAGHQLTLIQTKDIATRIKAQTCRQIGLSQVYDELLGFRGAEIYFKMEPRLWGKTFKEACLAFECAAVIGIRKKRRDVIPSSDPDPFLRKKERDIVLKPDFSYILEDGDALIVIGAGSDSLQLIDSPAELYKASINYEASDKMPPEHILILGWNKSSATLLEELDVYVPRGSEAEVYSPELLPEETVTYYQNNLRRLAIAFHQADTTNRQELEQIKVQDYNYVIVLSNPDPLSTEEADSRTLITLIHLREIARLRKATFNLVSEMADARNQALIDAAKPNEFIISDQLTSKLFSQLAANRELKHVFEELFDAYGCEIYLIPASNYLKLPAEVNFHTILQAAINKQHLALGYRLVNKDAKGSNMGLVLAPWQVDAVYLSPEDQIVILKED